MDYVNKKVLVTGGTGLIGRELVELLLGCGADVTVASLDDGARCPKDASFIRADLRDYETCLKLALDADVVFHLMGIKGSPKMSKERPADFFVPLLQCNTNMMEAAFRADVEWYLFTSSVGVYAPADLMTEDSVWKTFPSPNDKYPGWAKRMGELQAEVYKVQYGWDKVSIVRPANVYGRYDNFDPANAMVIPSLIRRIVDGENPLVCWGDGTPIRDFIHARDVAIGMMHMVDRSVTEPVNLGSGTGITIKELVETLVEISDEKPPVVWDSSKPNGDAIRLFDMTRAKSYEFEPTVSFKEGLREVYNFYKNADNRALVAKRYNIFTEK
jgi:GDP-L-fucose synthase